jgi:hypothetical protein
MLAGNEQANFFNGENVTLKKFSMSAIGFMEGLGTTVIGHLISSRV